MAGKDSASRYALQQLFQGYQVSQCIYVAAKLGIADLLKDGPRTDVDLARATATHAPSLYRILRLLAAVGILSEGERASESLSEAHSAALTEAHTFALTPLGSYLRADVPDSLRKTILFFGDQAPWQVWGDLLHSVETGEPAYPHIFGLSNWEYRAQHPEAMALFNGFMAESSAGFASAVAEAYDFSSIRILVDIGGAHGNMLASILRAYPTLRGVLFDLPHIVEGATRVLEAAGVVDRCEVLGGDAFAGVPPGGDAYLLSRVIHDWDDERATTLLARCRQVMQPGGKVLGRVLLIERVLPDSGAPDLLVLESDVNMLVTQSGKERTGAEYRALLAAAGLTLTRVIPVRSPFSLIEASRV